MRCRAATIGAVAVPGCARKSLDPDYPGRQKPPRICRTALTRAAAAPVHKRVDSVQHDPPPNRPRICAQRCRPSGSNRSSRQASGEMSCKRAAGWDGSKWSRAAPSAGSSTVLLRGQQRTARDLMVPERRCQRRRWRHQITRPHVLYQSRTHSDPNSSKSPKRSGCGTSGTAAARNGGTGLIVQSSAAATRFA